MSLGYAILAGLAHGPKTGYELSKGFQGSIGFFWTATHQQIYRELERIHEHGWATIAVEPQSGKPDRKVYTLTDAGRAALTSWIEAPTAPTPSRNPLLIKLYVGQLADRAALVGELERERAAHAAQLAEYLSIEAKYFSSVKEMSEARRFTSYTLRHGIIYEQGWISWCDEVLAGIKESPCR